MSIMNAHLTANKLFFNWKEVVFIVTLLTLATTIDVQYFQSSIYCNVVVKIACMDAHLLVLFDIVAGLLLPAQLMATTETV